MDDLTTLRQRLAEISDLGRAAGVLGWEQRVSMPPLGTESRAESLATLGRIIHERFTDPESRSPARPARTARGLAAVRLGRREPDPRDAPRLGEGPSSADRASRRDDAGGGPGAPGLGRRPEGRRLRRLPPLPADERRAEAPLHRVLRAGRPPLHGAARRLRARDDDDGGARGVRDAPPSADGARPHGSPASTRRSCTGRSTRKRSGASPSGSSRRSVSRTAPGASTRPPTRSARRSRTGTSDSRPGTGRTTSSRSGRRCTRPATGCTRTASRTH